MPFSTTSTDGSNDLNTIEQRAPLTGTIEQVLVERGQSVERGDLLAMVESMKVHVRLEAEATGKLEHLALQAGDAITRGQVIAKIVATEHTILECSSPPRNTASATQTHDEHPAIAAWQERTALSLDEQRARAIEKRHAKGYSSARENLARLCSPERFQEYGQLAVAAQRQRHDYDELKTSTAADGVITGVGEVNGVRTALVINDYTVLAGTQGFFHHQKIDRILAIAEQQALPVIMFTEGGGGRPGDTDVTVVNSGLQCTSFGAWAGLCGKVPRIAIANGYNFAGNAALFGAADITIATRSSWIGMAGPAMIAGGGLGEFKPTDIGPIKTQSVNGVVDIVVDDEAQACHTAKQLISMLAANNSDTSNTKARASEQSPLRSAMPANRRQTYSVREILNTIADQDSLIELQRNVGGSVLTAFMQIDGTTVGVLANDCSVLGGAIDTEAGQKAARFMQLCDDLSCPIVSFCDTPGFMVGPQHEELGAVRKLAELFKVGAQITVPFYAVVLRKCYGLGAQAMLGGSTQRPLYTMAWPSGEFGAMGLEGAVTLGFRKELEAQPDEGSRTALYEQLLEEQYAKGQATEVASVLELDAVIDPASTRSNLSRLL